MQTYIILTTITDKITKELVEKDLAKCIQIDKVKNCYKWEGKLLTDDECKLMVKAHSSSYKLIEQSILGLHNCKMSQILKSRYYRWF